MSTLPAVPAPIDWWAPPGVLHRVVSDLVAAELTALRRRPPDRALPWATTLHLIDDLDVDSLELLSLATRLSDFLHLHQSGIDDYLLARPTLDEWVAVAYTSLRQYAAQLTFRTSGSSGMPKPCPQPLSGLWQEIAALAPLFQGRRRILSAVPGHHIYGFLFTILLPQALQLDPGQVIDLRGSSVGALPHQLREGDLVVAHPDYWRQLQHPAVADAAVRLMRPDEGNRLKAFVVPATPPADETALATALASWLRQHLSSAERPVAFSFGAELPRQANGKPADWA